MKTTNYFIPMKLAFVSLITIKINGEAPGDDNDPVVVPPTKK